MSIEEVWTSVGFCGKPPKDRSPNFAFVAITLTLGVWFILPAIVGSAIAR